MLWLGHHLHHAFNREVTEVSIAHALRSFGMYAMSLYGPIYLFQYFNGRIIPVLAVYCCCSAGNLLLTPFVARLTTRIGIKHTMLLSSPFLILYLFAFWQIAAHPVFLALIILGYAIATPLYWISFHTDFARCATQERMGQEIGALKTATLLAIILGPLIGALVINQWGFMTLFLLLIGIEVLASLPLFLSAEVYERYNFRFRQEMTSLLVRSHLRDVVTFAADGMAEKIGMYLWPIFLFTALSGFLAIGGMTTATLLLSLLTGLTIGRFIDRRGRVGVFRVGVVVNACAWLFRAVVSGQAWIFLADGVSRVTINIMQVPFTSLLYQRARDRGGRLEHYLVLWHMAHHAGAVLVLLLAMAYFSFTSSIQGFFLLAAAASFVMLVYTRRSSSLGAA